MVFITKKTYFLFIALLLNLLAKAQNESAMAIIPQPEKVTSVEGITEYKLNNGLHLLVFPDPSAAKITVNITYMVGSRMEGYGETGMAHLLEHMVFKGSTGHTNIPQELTAHGAQPNGSTSFDRTNYFETFLPTDENLKWALDLESDRMVNSFIAKKDLETEFSVVRNEFEMGENYPGNILYERVMSTAYLWHNYGKATIGSKTDIERVHIENLQDFYHKYYQPDNAVLMVSGKIDEAKVVSLVNDYFGKISRPSRKIMEPYTREPVQDGERVCELRRTGDVQVVSAGYHICNGAHPDFAPLDVLEDVLTNVPSGRLYKALVETNKATRLWGYAEALMDPGYIYFSADVLKEKSLDDAKSTMMNLLDSLQYNPITPEEVERGKNARLKEFDISYNNSEEVGLELSEYIAQGDWRLWFAYRDAIEKVTAADVNRVVKDYFKPTNRTIGLFRPQENSPRAEIPENPDIKAMLSNYKGKEKLADAEVFDPSPDNIDKRTETGTIPGGAKYALLKKSTRGGAVNAIITLRLGSAGSLWKKGTIAKITGDMLMKGTQQKSRQQINDALDKLKAEVYAYAGGQQVTVHIKTVKENLVEVLKLVHEILRQPSFPQNEFDKLIQSTLDGIEQQKKDPQAIAFNTFNRIANPFPASDFRSTLTFDEQAAETKGVTLDEVKKFYADFYNSTGATMVVIGDFDPQPVKDELTATFQKWTSPEKFERAPMPFKDVAATMQKINTPDKTNASMAAGYNIEMRDDDPDYPVLALGNFMLGGGFINSRLAERIRQKEGISYGVGSWVWASSFDKSGNFGSYAIFNPSNVDKLLTAYKEELNKVVREGFTEDELTDARKGFLQDRQVGRADDEQLGYTLNQQLYEGRNMQFTKKEDEKISSASLSEVNAVMKKWLKPEKVTIILAGEFQK
jgi:zinc protease